MHMLQALVIKEGELLQKGGAFRSWRRRYFVLARDSFGVSTQSRALPTPPLADPISDPSSHDSYS